MEILGTLAIVAFVALLLKYHRKITVAIWIFVGLMVAFVAVAALAMWSRNLPELIQFVLGWGLIGGIIWLAVAAFRVKPATK